MHTSMLKNCVNGCHGKKKKNKFFFEDKIFCIFGIQMNNLAPKISWGCKVDQISSWADLQRGGGGDRESGTPPPPRNCQIINFCHVEIFRQTPSGNLDPAPPHPHPEKVFWIRACSSQGKGFTPASFPGAVKTKL